MAVMSSGTMTVSSTTKPFATSSSMTAGPERSSRSPFEAASLQVMMRAVNMPRILMKRTDFSYELPRELIAQEPRPRGRSRMMVVTPQDGDPLIDHRSFADFPQFLQHGEVLVINDTRVIPARLYAQPK